MQRYQIINHYFSISMFFYVSDLLNICSSALEYDRTWPLRFLKIAAFFSKKVWIILLFRIIIICVNFCQTCTKNSSRASLQHIGNLNQNFIHSTILTSLEATWVSKETEIIKRLFRLAEPPKKSLELPRKSRSLRSETSKTP